MSTKGPDRLLLLTSQDRLAQVDFHASLTINRCHFDRLCQIWARELQTDEFPFRSAIVSPLVARNGILERLFEHRQQCRVIFDSGGFHVQQGRLELSSATRQLREVYKEHDWADRFALPDTPITSRDCPETVKRKLRSNRRQYQVFASNFLEPIRRKLLPVVHGTTSEQIRSSARAARQVASESLGFGGFSTSGPNGGVNSFSTDNLRLLVQFAVYCKKEKLNAHVFGIGGPSAIVVLHYVGIDSFDSAGWIRTAAYGNVYLPYLGAVNITGATESRRFVGKREFAEMRSASQHSCPFCRDHKALVKYWPYRALHNYITVASSIHELQSTPLNQAVENMRRFNPRFANYLSLALCERNRLLEAEANPEIEAADEMLADLADDFQAPKSL